MKSPDRFMARGLAERSKDEKAGRDVILRCELLRASKDGCRHGVQSSFEARRRGSRLRMTAENVMEAAAANAMATVAAASAGAAVRASRRRCGLRSSSRRS